MVVRRSWRALAALGIASALAAFVAAAQAAPPPNDNFASAQPITGESGSATGTNAEATREPGEPAHAGESGGRSVWFRWTAPTSARVAFETCTGSTFDTLLAVYTGTSVGGLAVVAANDDSCGDLSRVIFDASAGTVYSIAIDGFEGETGGFTLRWRLVTPPPNDNFANAKPLAGSSGTDAGTNLGASRESGDPAQVETSVWYTWTAPFTGGVGFETCGSSFDTFLVAFTGSSLDALTVVAFNDDACRFGSRVRFLASAGTTYRLLVFGVDGSAGDIKLAWLLANRPPNDDFAAARRIRGAKGSVGGSNAGAVAEAGEPPHRRVPSLASMWYRWRAPRTMGISFETCGRATFDTLIGVYRGSVLRRVVRVGEDDDSCANDRSRVVFVAQKGVEYRIVVDGFLGAAGTFTLKWGRPSPFAAPCRVPDVRGLSLAQARRRLTAANCTLGRVVYTRSSIVPAGRVISQFPNPGARLRFQARVNLEVSRGS